MRPLATFALAILAPAIVAGCASKLAVYKEKSGGKAGEAEAIAGMPFNTSEVYVKTGWHNRMAKADDAGCDDAQFVETVLLPTGERYYLNVDAMPFTKTGFVVKFGASGNLSEVTLNTEPAGAEEIKAVTELVKVLTPPAAATVRSTDGGKARKACDAGERDVTFCPISAFREGKCK